MAMATDTPDPAMMRAVRVHPPGSAGDVSVDEVPMPTVSKDEVLVRVHAAALTRDELGWPVDRLPAIPSYELSGTVAGAGTAGLEPGMAVCGMTDFEKDGVAAEYAAVAGDRLVPMPSSLTHAQAAAFPLPALSALQGLFDHGRLTENERVLIHGGAGVVGAYAVQLAKLHGSYVIATASTTRVEMARRIGADEVIDHSKSDFATIEPVDLVFDTAGGDRLRNSVDVLRPGGRLISVAEDPPMERARRAGIEAKWYLVESRRDQLVELASLIDQGRLRVEVFRTFPFTEVGEAFARLEEDGTGKIVLTVVEES